MSRETLEWLNKNTLIGFTEKRGNAWHYRAGTDNHYVGPVPVEDVRRRLFDFKVEAQPIILGEPVTPNLDVSPPRGSVVLPGPLVPDKVAIVNQKTGFVYGVFGSGWQPHQYDEWLLENVETILDDNLQIGSAGLLQHGGVAWVQVEVPETMEFAGGVTGRPFLLAATSMNGLLSSTYGASLTAAVCDNTLAVAQGEHGGFRKKVRHSRNSLGKIQDVRDALGVIHTTADDFGRQVKELLDTPFVDRQFEELLTLEVPGERPAITEHRGSKWAAWTKVERKREVIRSMYQVDERVAPWHGTAYGAWQAFNTYAQHESPIRKTTNRVERNALSLVTGKQEKADFSTLEKIMELAS